MNNRIYLYCGLGLGIFLAGCTTKQSLSGLTEPTVAPKHRADQHGRFSDGYSGRPTHTSPSGELTLRKAMELSLEQNLALQAYGWEVERAVALERQAGIWKNPELEVELEGIGADTENTEESTISLAQSLPLGRDIKRRRDLAAIQTDLTNWDYEAARMEVMMNVTQRFVEALATDRRLLLAEQELAWAQTTQTVTSKRVEAGDISPVELSRVIVPVVTAEVRLKKEKRQRKNAYGRLALLWDGKEVTFDSVAGDLDTLPSLPDPDALRRLISQNPEVARWAVAISERIARRRLTQSNAIPDPTIRLGIKREEAINESSMVLGISLPLPAFDRRQGDLLAARKGEQAARARLREAELRIEGLISNAYTDLANARDEALALRERALPAAEEAFSATRKAFAEGKLSFLDVLDAQRTLFGLQRDYLAALELSHIAAAEIESLIAQELPE